MLRVTAWLPGPDGGETVVDEIHGMEQALHRYDALRRNPDARDVKLEEQMNGKWEAVQPSRTDA